MAAHGALQIKAHLLWRKRQKLQGFKHIGRFVAAVLARELGLLIAKRFKKLSAAGYEHAGARAGLCYAALAFDHRQYAGKHAGEGKSIGFAQMHQAFVQAVKHHQSTLVYQRQQCLRARLGLPRLHAPAFVHTFLNDSLKAWQRALELTQTRHIAQVKIQRRQHAGVMAVGL